MKLIIASVPRTGSTLLFRSIIGLPPGGTTPPEYYVCDKPFHQSIAQTHSIAERVLYNKCKAIFTFRDPVECIISTRLHRWDKNHFMNCGVYDKDPKDCDIYSEDILGYEKIFDSWTKDNGYPVLALRYDTLYKYLREIESFVGNTIQFPQWKPRENNIKNNRNKETKENIEKIEMTYHRFIDKVNNMDPIVYYN